MGVISVMYTLLYVCIVCPVAVMHHVLCLCCVVILAIFATKCPTIDADWMEEFCLCCVVLLAIVAVKCSNSYAE